MCKLPLRPEVAQRHMHIQERIACSARSTGTGSACTEGQNSAAEFASPVQLCPEKKPEREEFEPRGRRISAASQAEWRRFLCSDPSALQSSSRPRRYSALFLSAYLIQRLGDARCPDPLAD